MSTLAVREAQPVAAPAAADAGMSSWQFWGLIMIAPYVLIFLLFVLYPVSYGLWTARHPQSYVHLWEDPIFARSVVNTLVFLIVGVNLKMIVALLLSGFFAVARPWIRWLSLLFILPWAVPSIPTILSFRFMLNPEWGVINQLIFKLTAEDGPNWLNDPTLALSLAIVVHIWKAVLDADPPRRASRHLERPLRGGLGRRRLELPEVRAHHLAVDADALSDLHHP